MNETLSKRIKQILQIATAVSIVLAAGCLMVACLQLYLADAFTPEDVAAAFRPIRLPVYLCLGLSVLGLISAPFLPADGKKPRGRKIAYVPPKAVGRPAVIRTVILCLALAALAYGYFTGGTVDVLTKAVNICTECVGLG